MGNITGLCDPKNSQKFTCAGAKVMYNASLIWGTIGPQRMFQSGQVYNALMYFFLIGVSPPPSPVSMDLTLCLACGDRSCVAGLPPLPQQLGQVHQCAHLLQWRGEHPACQHQSVPVLASLWCKHTDTPQRNILSGSSSDTCSCTSSANGPSCGGRSTTVSWGSRPRRRNGHRANHMTHRSAAGGHGHGHGDRDHYHLLCADL